MSKYGLWHIRTATLINSRKPFCWVLVAVWGYLTGKKSFKALGSPDYSMYPADYIDTALNNIFLIVPDAAPIIIQSIPISYYKMKITWLPIPMQKRNGIIRGYHIYYKDVTEYKWNVYTTLMGNISSTIVPGLQSYTEYCVKISIFTSKGEYPHWKDQSCRRVKSMSFTIYHFVSNWFSNKHLVQSNRE